MHRERNLHSKIRRSRPCGKPRRRWEDNFKIYLKEGVRQSVYLIHLNRNRGSGGGRNEHSVPTIWASFGFTRKNMLCWVGESTVIIFLTSVALRYEAGSISQNTNSVGLPNQVNRLSCDCRWIRVPLFNHRTGNSCSRNIFSASHQQTSCGGTS